MSIYYTGTLESYAVPKTETNLTGSLANWQYQGCYSDNVNGKALFWQVELYTNNSAEACLGLCQQYGYMSAGMEYGEEVSYSIDLAENHANHAVLLW